MSGPVASQKATRCHERHAHLAILHKRRIYLLLMHCHVPICPNFGMDMMVVYPNLSRPTRLGQVREIFRTRNWRVRAQFGFNASDSSGDKLPLPRPILVFLSSSTSVEITFDKCRNLRRQCSTAPSA